jgi:GT2 family glycosyltransferase
MFLSSQSTTKGTLRSKLLKHDNDYGFDPRDEFSNAPALSVSCVVPYYETGALGVTVARQLAEALSEYRTHHDAVVATQLVVVDDGSVARPFPSVDADFGEELVLVRLKENVGRSAARNVGLRQSTNFDVTIFVDSDVLVQHDQVSRIVELYSLDTTSSQKRDVIVANLFTTLRRPQSGTGLLEALQRAAIQLDWRWKCRFQPSWIGCSGDTHYVGIDYQLVSQTDFFRSWTGMVGPWSLSNMVLGGCFAVPTMQALEVGGFDESFALYGFTETTLVTKLIAQGVPVIPQSKAAALHVEWNTAHLSQSDRTSRFRSAHSQFYKDFLAETI